jgi:hypothetical protein
VNSELTSRPSKRALAATLISCLVISACSGMRQHMEETKARGPLEVGGYTWRITAESESGNTVSTNGLPSRQYATEASNTLCKKYGRIAQFVKQTGSLLLGRHLNSIACVEAEGHRHSQLCSGCNQ